MRAGCDQHPARHFYYMPIFEYECKDGHITEVMHQVRSNAKEHIKCSDCNKRAKRRTVPTSSTFHLRLFFGSKYNYAAPSDRDDFANKPLVTEW